MDTLIRNLLFTSMIFFNFVQSSPMKKWEASDLRAKIEPGIPGLPKPQLCIQGGRPVGVYYNGKVYPVEEKPEPGPTPRPSSPPPLPPIRYIPRTLPQHVLESFRPSARFLQADAERFSWINFDFPEDCQLERGGAFIGRARAGWMLDGNGRPIARFETGDLLYYEDNIFAMYIGNRFELMDEEFRFQIQY